MKKLLVLMLVTVLGLSLSGATLAKNDKGHDNDREDEHDRKISICHKEGKSGEYHLIRVDEHAWKGHMKHGDGKPGDDVPNMEDKKFDSECKVLDEEHEWKEVEIVTVNSAAMAGANSLILESGKKYRFNVSGEWQNRGNEKVDTKFTTADNWDTHTDAPYGGWPEKLLELQVNENWVEWGSYNAIHEYTSNFDGNGTAVNFRVFDGDVTTNELNAGWYGDNIGNLTIKIFVLD